MDAKEREVRTLDCQLTIREAGADAQGESRTIVGTAIVFDSESEMLDDWGYRFREVIKPEAVTKDFLDSQDIKMNMLHDRQLTVARCNHGKGSLRLSVDEKGVQFEFDAPRCDIGERCLEMVRRGDYSGCSFEFYPDVYEVEERGENDMKITHKRFKAITALTIGLDPAYRKTSVNVREMCPQETKAEEEPVEPVTDSETVEAAEVNEAFEEAVQEIETNADAEREAMEREREERMRRRREMMIEFFITP